MSWSTYGKKHSSKARLADAAVVVDTAVATEVVTPVVMPTYEELIAQRELLIDELAEVRNAVRRNWNTANQEVRLEHVMSELSQQKMINLISARQKELNASLTCRSEQEVRDDLSEIERQIAVARDEAKQRVSENIADLRKPYIGKVVKLEGKFADLYATDNPFALDPTFDWARQRQKHFEQQKWTYGSVHSTGIVLKARTKVGLEAMGRTLDALAPVIKEFGLDKRVSHIYEFRGNTRIGGQCSIVRQGGFMAAITGDAPELLPPTIAISSDQHEDKRIYTTVHELAHLNAKLEDEAHGDRFRVRFGEYLGRVMEQGIGDQTFLTNEAATDTYAQPILPFSLAATLPDDARQKLVDGSVKFVKQEGRNLRMAQLPVWDLVGE